MSTTHPSLSAGLSQCDRILAELQRCAGEWVAMPRLARLSGAYAVHSRVADLRKRGHPILHENRRTPGSKVIRSFYQLSLPDSQS
jgi:hypothetical protein